MNVHIVVGYDRIDDKDIVKAVFLDKPNAESYRDKHNEYWDIEEHKIEDTPKK